VKHIPNKITKKNLMLIIYATQKYIVQSC